MLTLKDLLTDEYGRYVLHGSGNQRFNELQAKEYLLRLSAKPVRKSVLPCGATVERRYTPWKTRVLSI